MRLPWVLLSSLACAGSVLVSAFMLRDTTATAQRERRARVAQVLVHDERSTRAMLKKLCERAARPLALATEPNAALDDLARAVLDLGIFAPGELKLYEERADAIVDVAGRTGEERPTYALLQCARAHRCWWPSDPPRVLDACTFSLAARRFWIARAPTYSGLLTRSGLSDLVFATPILSSESAAYPLKLAERAPAGSVALTLRPARDDGWLPTLLWLTALSFGLGGALGFLLTREQPVDETVLRAIEHATDRVARGDLSGSISLTVQGRADQTLRSFDRMTVELRETRAKLAEAERAGAWQDMARRIAHELKNPLSPIKMAIETLRKAHQKRLASFDEIFAESTQAMYEEVERLERIVREFAEFARLPKARPGLLDLTSVVHDAAALYTGTAVTLTMPSTTQRIEIHADRELLVQVLVNLLNNAFDAVHGRDVPHVALGVARNHDAVMLWVEDNGEGVPEHDRERIFEPYVTGKTHGTGLGLAIVKRIVQDQSGSVHVEVSPLGGARFVITLPSSRA